MSKFSEPKRVLVFNQMKRLVAICQSVNATAEMFKTSVQSIFYVCSGKSISCNGYYFRKLDDEIEVTFDDLGVLTIQEYDSLCGVERKIYPTSKMTRKGMKYKKRTYVAPSNPNSNEKNNSSEGDK